MKFGMELQPMRTPNYVLAKMPPGLRQDGFKEDPKFHLRELTPELLSDLCDEFRKDIFKKAGKDDPKSS